MYNFQKYLAILKSAILNQNYQTQIQVISEFLTYIEQSPNKESVIRDILNLNIGDTLNDAITTQLTVLIPTLKLFRHLMEDLRFQDYHFLQFFQNVIRVLILLVRSDRIQKSQLEFFEVVHYLDVFLKMFLSEDSSRKENPELQTMFVCLLNFVELVNSEKSISMAIRNLMLEIFVHLLKLVKIQNCIFKNFQLIMRVSNLADEFLGDLIKKCQKELDELRFFKITEILFRLLESCHGSDTLQVKCVENIFYRRLGFVLEQIMIQNSKDPNLEIFKFYIAMLNVILWTPSFSKSFSIKIIKKIINLKADSIIFALSKKSRKIRKHTKYTMKMFLASLIVHSSGSLSLNKHYVLVIFLQARFSKSFLYLRTSDVIKNSKLLILLYGCSFLKHHLRSPLNANRVLENLAVILQNLQGYTDGGEIWSILRILSYFSKYAVLSALEYIGLQKISEILLPKANELLFDKQKDQYRIDKYILSFANEFSTNSKILNSMFLAYFSQEPSQFSLNVCLMVPTSEVLPFIFSNDHNQVVNAVRILQKKHLKDEDLDFIVKHCLINLKSEEIIIEGALILIDKNLKCVSAVTGRQVFQAAIAFLECKKVYPKYSTQSYCLMIATCVSLIRSISNTDLKFEEFDGFKIDKKPFLYEYEF